MVTTDDKGKKTLRLRRTNPLWGSDVGGFHFHQCVKASEQTHFILITCKEQATTYTFFPHLYFCFVAFSFHIPSYESQSARKFYVQKQIIIYCLWEARQNRSSENKEIGNKKWRT